MTYYLFVFANVSDYVRPEADMLVMDREAFCKAQRFPGVQRLMAEMEGSQMLEQFGTMEYERKHKVPWWRGRDAVDVSLLPRHHKHTHICYRTLFFLARSTRRVSLLHSEHALGGFGVGVALSTAAALCT